MLQRLQCMVSWDRGETECRGSCSSQVAREQEEVTGPVTFNPTRPSLLQPYIAVNSSVG